MSFGTGMLTATAFARDSGDMERWLIAAIASVLLLRGARLLSYVGAGAGFGAGAGRGAGGSSSMGVAPSTGMSRDDVQVATGVAGECDPRARPLRPRRDVPRTEPALEESIPAVVVVISRASSSYTAAHECSLIARRTHTDPAANCLSLLNTCKEAPLSISSRRRHPTRSKQVHRRSR